ncbi:chemotaxis protein CheA [Methylocapsa acidiphila]|uniref:chemotaxis protein CheA n=1 Tax=Methylocapsa acidiphila TaxID=133552 RepID=UPI0003F9D2CC|nr:chemotaxis protein CheA [Methylocapsa acidiphila]
MTDNAELIDAFRQEAADLLDALEAALLDLEKAPQNRDLIDTAFRALHTIKGSGAMFGFDQVAAFTHDFESAFDKLRKGTAQPSADLVAVALTAKDYIRALIKNPDSTDAIIGASILADLKQAIEADRTDIVQIEQNGSAPVATSRGWSIDIAFAASSLRNGANPLAMLDELRELGACVATPILDDLPDLPALDPETLFLKWRVELASECAAEAIEDIFIFVRDEMTLQLAPVVEGRESTRASVEAPPQELTLDSAPHVAGETARAHVATAAVGPESATLASDEHRRDGAERRQASRRAEDKSAQTMRVSAERLDQLMDRVGELVIAQARLSQIAASSADLATKAIAEEIERLAAALRDTTMGARMVPIGSLFGRFRRLVHDLSRDLGKPVEFVALGEETELDKTVIERLADPLVHLIRNAIDHGIEEPARRAASGKPAQGRIELSASHVGAQVFICVSDNGAGLDTARIRAKAEEQGLVAPGAALSEQEIHQFLFHPGFSTAKSISALSGRGVGMDVVKQTIESMRGSIDISTKAGEGARITLRLPLTLAIIEGLLVRVGAERYVIPLAAVEECVELSHADQEASRERSFLNIRGELVPYIRLRDMFRADGEPDRHQKVIVTSTGDMRLGLVVDQIIGSHQTVIKSLSKLHANVAMFSGATILGDGGAALILDVAQLLSMGQSQADANLSEAA